MGGGDIQRQNQRDTDTQTGRRRRDVKEKRRPERNTDPSYLPTHPPKKVRSRTRITLSQLFGCLQ